MGGVVIPNRDKDGHQLVSPRKSYKEPSRSFTTPDYSDKTTWFGDLTRHENEALSTADNITYSSLNQFWIDWKKIPNHVRQFKASEVLIEIKKNDVIITSGFSIDHAAGTITFDSANQPSDIIKATYSVGNSTKFDLLAEPGKKLKVDYVEVQFSEGAIMPEGDCMLFQSIYNGPAIPSLGIPANFDIPLRTFEYWGYRDFLGESTGARECLPFMGMSKKSIILPWDYLTGHTIVPIGEVADLAAGEFHKLRCVMKNNGLITNCEIATGTFYCIIGDYGV